MKNLVWSVGVSVFVLSSTTILWAAQDTACLDQAQTQQEIDRCLDQTYTPLVEQIDSEFERLVEKFKADQDISEALRLTKRAWQNYHTSECVLEGLVADYPTEQKKPEAPNSKRGKSLHGSKASSRCAIRTAQELYAVLVKL